jgi:hypothetical protein
VESVSYLAIFVDHVAYTRRLEGEKTAMEQEIDECGASLTSPSSVAQMWRPNWWREL